LAARAPSTTGSCAIARNLFAATNPTPATAVDCTNRRRVQSFIADSFLSLTR
jgi:hypothetical protein